METNILDYIIVGAGPAGLQLGYFMQKSRRNYLILETESIPGSFFNVFPRHRKLISINKRYNGSNDPEFNLRMDWNSLLSDNPDLLFTKYSENYFPGADEFVQYMADFAHTFKLNIKYNSQVIHIIKDETGFTLTLADTKEQYKCKFLIVATGVSKAQHPDFPGAQYVESYNDVSVDPNDFINQRVLIIGKGNSAFETADNLVATAAAIHVAGANAIKMAWKTHYVGHLRAVNNNLLDTYQLKSQNALLDGKVIKIEKKDNKYAVVFSFSRANEVQKELIYDRVIACTGFRFDASIFDKTCKPELIINDRFPNQTSSWESTNIPGLYFAGGLMQARDYKKSTSGFVHGFRYCVKALYHILENKNHANKWPATCLTHTSEDLMQHVIKRVNRTSALWQQFEFMGDVIVPNGNNQALYYEELPVAYLHESEFSKNTTGYFIITLEYGPDHASVDPFDISVARVAQNNSQLAFNAQYLHPVIRYFHNGQQMSEHHIAENLENEWDSVEFHQKPLMEFFETTLKTAML